MATTFGPIKARLKFILGPSWELKRWRRSRISAAMQTISKILIANRGEIAVRIARTCRRLGIQSVAIYSDADADALFVSQTDEKIRIGPPAPKESYLNVEAIVKAAKESGAQAVHPGYGFLSENAEFARRLQEEGLLLIGPPQGAVRMMGSKIESRLIARHCGVPIVPGSEGAVTDLEAAQKIAEEIGYPVMVKASAGGGGIGMARVDDPAQLARVYEDAAKKAATFFSDPAIFIERAIIRPRHIEVQVFGDQQGHLIHLGERECSIQRRNQKVIEETPSPFVTPALREEMTTAALKLAHEVGYYSSGTVEFIVDEAGRFYFLEMNTRLQVEHTVTEMVTGLDLVEWQIIVARGGALPLTQDQVQFKGHSLQLRLCAEDPDKRFMPSPGKIQTLTLPSESAHVRCDMGVQAQSQITPYYDSMFGKLITWDHTREAVIQRALEALSHLQVEGIKSNLELHRKVLSHPEFQAGRLSTAFLKEVLGYQF